MKPKTKTLLFILLSFALGAVAGVLALDAGWFRASRGPRPSAQEFRSEFHRKLTLDSMQVRVIDSLLDTYWERMSSHREAMMRDRDTLRSEIRRRLTDQQQQAYDAMNRAMDSRYERGRRDSTKQ